MPNRVTLGDVCASRLPQAVGLCASDVSGVAAITNAAQQRILFARELGDSGWFGGWASLSFDVTQEDPFITLPRGFTSISEIDVCSNPVPIRNQFWEFLLYGFGRLPKSTCASRRCGQLQALDRGFFPTFSDVIPPGKKLRIYLTDTSDSGKRILVGYKDSNGVPVRTLDGAIQVDGEFLTLAAPFVDTTYEVSVVTSLIKDITLGRVTIYELDIATSDQRLISFMEPGETVAGYRRYFIDSLPRSCCNPPTGSTTVQVQTLCRVDFIPVVVITDYLTVPNLEAVTNEAQSIRYSSMDEANAKTMEEYHHRACIRLLQGQLVANEGKLNPAVSFSPFGRARFVSIGTG